MTSRHPDNRSKQGLTSSFANAWRGIASASKERNFRIELCFAVLAVALSAAFQVSLGEWAAVLVCVGAVLGLECVNTAVEAVVDLVSPERNALAGLAKDAAAGGVLVASVASLVVGVLLFAPRILHLMGLM